MKPFLNFVSLVFMSFLYSLKHEKLNECVIREWVDKVLCKFNISVECKGNFDASGVVIMSNHESYFDILALYKCFDKVKLLWVAKKELFSYPIISKALKDIDAIGVNRGNEKEAAIALLRLMRRFKEGAVVIFPQGARKSDRFKKGGLFIAKKKRLPILPVKIVGSDFIMPPYKLALRSGKVVVEAFEKIDTNRFSEEELERIIREKIYN